MTQSFNSTYFPDFLVVRAVSFLFYKWGSWGPELRVAQGCKAALGAHGWCIKLRLHRGDLSNEGLRPPSWGGQASPVAFRLPLWGSENAMVILIGGSLNTRTWRKVIISDIYWSQKREQCTMIGDRQLPFQVTLSRRWREGSSLDYLWKGGGEVTLFLGLTVSGHFKKCPQKGKAGSCRGGILNSGSYLNIQTLGVSRVVTMWNAQAATQRKVVSLKLVFLITKVTIRLIPGFFLWKTGQFLLTGGPKLRVSGDDFSLFVQTGLQAWSFHLSSFPKSETGCLTVRRAQARMVYLTSQVEHGMMFL